MNLNDTGELKFIELIVGGVNYTITSRTLNRQKNDLPKIVAKHGISKVRHDGNGIPIHTENNLNNSFFTVSG